MLQSTPDPCRNASWALILLRAWYPPQEALGVVVAGVVGGFMAEGRR